MNKLLTFGVGVLAVAGIVGVGGLTASALNGESKGSGYQAGSRLGAGKDEGYRASLEARAKVFGMSIEDLKLALETKTMSQIAIEKGISESEFKTKMMELAQARWEAKGLSDDEIAERIAEREQRHATNSEDHTWGSGEGGHQGGYGKNR